MPIEKNEIFSVLFIYRFFNHSVKQSASSFYHDFRILFHTLAYPIHQRCGQHVGADPGGEESFVLVKRFVAQLIVDYRDNHTLRDFIDVMLQVLLLQGLKDLFYVGLALKRKIIDMKVSCFPIFVVDLVLTDLV